MSQINETAIKTPGVYVTEIPAFPPAIAQVATAIPVFIGYTQFAIDEKGNSLTNVPSKISSSTEYNFYFGGPPSNLETDVYLNPDNSVNKVKTSPSFQMFNAVSMFFYNGGGDCYIFSVKNYDDVDLSKLITYFGFNTGVTPTPPTCFDILKKYDEPTLIIIPDAAILVYLNSPNDYNTLINEALQHCGDPHIQSRFTIIDVPQSDVTSPMAIESTVDKDSNTNFRNSIVGSNLNYGAAYYPYLQTNMPCPSSYTSIKFWDVNSNPLQLSSILPANDLNVLQIINVAYDQINFVMNLTGKVPAGFQNLYDPNANATPPAPQLFDLVTAGNIIAGNGTNISISDAYNSIPNQPSVTSQITPDSQAKQLVINSLEFIMDVIYGFVKLYSQFKDNPKATGYTNTSTAPPTYLLPQGVTIQEKHFNYIQPGTTSLSAIEQLLTQLIAVDLNYPKMGPPYNGTPPYNDSAPLNIVSHVTGTNFDSVQGWLNILPNIKYLINTTPNDINNPYKNTEIASDVQAKNIAKPLLDNVFNTLLSMISNFASDVASRLNSVDVQLASSNAVYNNIKTFIKNTGLIVPSSGTMAGVYAATDGTRGVWKAPANVALLNVIKPTIPIDDDLQEDLNIDPNSGKSINAIRAFTGKGTLVWGARTLTGNDNDFRYISVRRFFIMVEQSVKLAAFQFVFESNDSKTWTRIRAMIENYLTNLWRQGALAGSKPEQSFYVKVGLGQTMIFDDILNGRLIVEIGMAPVRPAEFIILRFTQIQQTS